MHENTERHAYRCKKNLYDKHLSYDRTPVLNDQQNYNPLKKFSQNVVFNFALTTGRVGSTCSIWLTGFDFLREFHRKDFVHR